MLHAKALPGNPYDGHTLRTVIEDAQNLTGCKIERVYVDKGYRGHDAPHPRRVFISGQNEESSAPSSANYGDARPSNP